MSLMFSSDIRNAWGGLIQGENFPGMFNVFRLLGEVSLKKVCSLQTAHRQAETGRGLSACRNYGFSGTGFRDTI